MDPYIFITDSPFLENLLRTPTDSRKIVAEQIPRYQKAWNAEREVILRGITECTDLEFAQNYVEVFVVSAPILPFSHPVTINAQLDAERFVDVLTHMLIHILLWKNTQKGYYYVPHPHFEQVTQNNIYVDAIQQCIYLEILKKPDRLKREIEQAQQHPGLKEAWDIVQGIGYERLIEQLKKSTSSQ